MHGEAAPQTGVRFTQAHRAHLDDILALEQAAYPLPYLAECKFWPSVGRIDNNYGDRNLVCSCPPIANYFEQEPPSAVQA